MLCVAQVNHKFLHDYAIYKYCILVNDLDVCDRQWISFALSPPCLVSDNFVYIVSSLTSPIANLSNTIEAALSGVMSKNYDSKSDISIYCFLFNAFEFLARPWFFNGSSGSYSTATDSISGASSIYFSKAVDCISAALWGGRC